MHIKTNCLLTISLYFSFFCCFLTKIVTKTLFFSLLLA